MTHVAGGCEDVLMDAETVLNLCNKLSNMEDKHTDVLSSFASMSFGNSD